MIGKCLRKIIQQLFFIFCILKKKKYAQLKSQKLNRIVKKKMILLLIPNEKKEGWHYLAVKKLSTLSRGITFNYCLNYLHSYRTENKLKSHEKVCENKDFVES